MSQTTDFIVQAIVIIGFGVWAYSAVKRQSLRDTFLEIKELVGGFKGN